MLFLELNLSKAYHFWNDFAFNPDGLANLSNILNNSE